MGKRSKETDVELYRLMLRIRVAERRIVDIYPTDKIQSPIHLSVGQEAVSAGLCAALRREDRVYGTYRGHGLFIAKGGGMRAMFAELYGKDAGCARGKGGSMHLAAPEAGLMGCSAIVASLIPVAVGDAMGAKMRGLDRVTAAVFGDGATDEGVFFESVNFAMLKNLPVLFVCENNRYAIHSTVADRRKQTDLSKLAVGLGLRGRKADGDDVFAVHAEVAAAAARLRKGGPPEFLEFSTHRWHEHVGAGTDFQEAYRARGEEKRARAADPLAAAKKELIKRWKLAPKDFAALEERARAEVEDAVAFAEKAPVPAPSSLLADVYAPR